MTVDGARRKAIECARRDKSRADAKAFERLKAEPLKAFADPDSAYKPLDADTVIQRNSRKAK